MIKKVYRSRADLANLSEKKIVHTLAAKVDYKGIVVKKPWGYEYLLFENSDVAAWVLFLDGQTSMHCHPSKKTTLISLSGRLATSTLFDVFALEKDDVLVIDSAVFHSTKASKQLLIEVETPVNKGDLVRLKDEYGRENKGYEGKDSMDRNVKGYEYGFLQKEDVVLRSRKISLENGLNAKGKIFCLVKSSNAKLIGEAYCDAIPEQLKAKDNIFLVIK